MDGHLEIMTARINSLYAHATVSLFRQKNVALTAESGPRLASTTYHSYKFFNS